MASGFGITGTIKGLAETQAALKSLPGKMQRAILRPALAKATKPVFMHARKNAPKDSGLLRKSITRKVITYQSGTLVVVIGPDTKHRKEVIRKGSYNKNPQIANPAKYAHLVEFGTRPHSIEKGDRLARVGEAAKRVQMRAIANIRRWGQRLAESTSPSEAARLQKRIDKTKKAASTARVMVFTLDGKRHPGTKPKPFLRPAFDSTRDQVQQIFAAEVRKNIEKIAAKKGIAI